MASISRGSRPNGTLSAGRGAGLPVYETDGNTARVPKPASEIGYDLSRFDNRRRVREVRYEEARSVPARHRQTETRTHLSPLSLLCSAAAVAMAVVLIWSYMNLTIISDQLSDAKDDYAELVNTGVLLKTKVDSRYDLDEIEEYAQAKLGMSKLERSQIEYVELSSPDTITRVAPEENSSVSYVVAGLVKSFNAALDFLQNN